MRGRAGRCTVLGVDTASAIRLLPAAYAAAVVLADEGIDAERIARILGIDTRSVRPMLVVARAKLAALEAVDDHESGATQ